MLPLDFNEYVTYICKDIKSKPKREEVMEELLCHLEDNFERNLAVGMSEEEARLNAIKKMGDGESLSYYLSEVHSHSPIKEMNSSFVRIIISFIGMNFLFSGTVKGIVSVLGIVLMFFPLLRMRKMNGKAEKAFHFFNFFALSQLFYYCFSIGTELPFWTFYAYAVTNTLFEGLFWLFLFGSLYELCDRHLDEEIKRPKLVLCGVYYMLSAFVTGFILILSEGENVTLNDFVLPIIMIFMFIYTLVQLFRAKNLLWAAEGEYGIQPADKKNLIIYCCALLFCCSAVIGCNYLASTKEPVKTELIIHDLSAEEQKEADKVREKMLSWDVQAQIVEDLPDSEILKYKDAEFVTWGADGGSMGGSHFETGAQSDLWYYWFFIPDKEYEGNYDVRLLCYIESHYSDSIKGLYRKGFYYVPWYKGVFPLNLDDELNGSFISIITEENGKKYNSEPLFTYNLTDENITTYPKGFEYHEEKGQRVYYSTQIGVTNLEQSVSLYSASVRQRTFSPFQYYNTAGFIETVMSADRITSRSGDLYPFAYRLHPVFTGNIYDKVFDLEARQSYEYSGGYPKEY